MPASLITQVLTLLGVSPTTADPVNFDARGDALLGALPNSIVEQNTFRTQANALATQANTDAQAAAAAAAAAQALVNAVAFNGATAYAQYAAAISTVNLLTYRRKTAGTSATDPSADSANWVNTGLPPVVVVRTAVDVNPLIPGTVYIATAAGLNFTLPAAPGGQDLCSYRLGVGVSSLTLKGNGNKIEGQVVGTDISINSLGRMGKLSYNATDGWLHIP